MILKSQPKDELCTILDTVVSSPKIKTFDWNQAVRLIKKHNIKNAEAFLLNDEWATGGVILHDGKPVLDSEAYLESYNDIPVIRDLDTGMLWECYKIIRGSNWTVEALQELGLIE